MTLRERLLALADDCELIRGDLVMAAAWMALEEAEKAMDSGDVVDWVEAGAAIRALRDGLEDK